VLERKSGFTQMNSFWCVSNTCRQAVDASTPFAEQVRALNVYGAASLEAGDFTRLREVAAALDVPASVARALRVRSATVVLSARNLALWTHFSGPDPESGTVTAGIDPLVNPGAASIPQGRTVSLRLDLGL